MTSAAVLVTRGDVDLSPILESHAAVDEIAFTYIWDNSREQDLSVYGRYAAIERFSSEIVFAQDDDCVLPPESIRAILEAYGRDHVVCNQPEEFRHPFYDDHGLIGFGSVFHRDAPAQAFARMWAGLWEGRGIEMPDSDLWRRAKERAENPAWWPQHFLRTCDIVFTGLTPRVLVDVPKQNLWWADDDTRMYKQQGHSEERARMLELVKKLA